MVPRHPVPPLLAALLLGTALCWCPASADDFAEGNAAAWGTFASDGAAATVEDDDSRVKVGHWSVRFVTESGFDTGVTYPATADAHWNLLDRTHLVFWEYAVNTNPAGFQGNQPVVVLKTPTGDVRLEPAGCDMTNRAWRFYRVPLAGDEHWTRTDTGQPDLSDVLQLEIHQDTWDSGFTIHYDGVEFRTYDNPGGLPPAGPPPPPGVDPDEIPARVLLFVFDPVMPNLGGLPRHEAYGWGDPVTLAAAVRDDLETHSHGRARYRIVETRIVDDWPWFDDGFRYDPESYDEARRTGNWHEGGRFDYARFIADAGIAPRIERGELDEIWIYGGPGDGMWESTMAGDGAYWCNSPPVEGVPSERAFVLMGWNYERGVAEALHSWGHRAENNLDHVYGPREPNRDTTWSAFCLQDRQAEGEGSIGDVHFPVNGETDYDYANPRYVLSDCDDWYSYPDLPGNRRWINFHEWSPAGEDPQREYLDWWYDHMPHVPSKGNDQYLANWWRYLVDVDQFKAWNGNLYWSSGYGDVVILAPGEGEEVAGTVPVRVRVTMDGATGRVDLYVDGQYVATDHLAPFVFSWDATAAGTGDHVLEARAYELQNGTESRSEAVTVTVVEAPPPPGEVSPPGSPEPLRFLDRVTLAWEDAAASGAEWFNLYRGNAAWLRDGVPLACLRPDLPENRAEDAEVPGAGTAWAYLVTGENGGGEGPRGTDSDGAPRPSDPSCP